MYPYQTWQFVDGLLRRGQPFSVLQFCYKPEA